jgi:hypothetical protein
MLSALDAAGAEYTRRVGCQSLIAGVGKGAVVTPKYTIARLAPGEDRGERRGLRATSPDERDRGTRADRAGSLGPRPPAPTRRARPRLCDRRAGPVSSGLISVREADRHGSWLVYALVRTPGVASLVARLVLREGSRTSRSGSACRVEAIGLSWLLPVAIGFGAYGLAWATGLANSRSRHSSAGSSGLRLPSLASFSASRSRLVSFLTRSSRPRAGDRWRGYLLTRLVEAGSRGRSSERTRLGVYLPSSLGGQYARPNRALSLANVLTVTERVVIG